MIRILLGGCCGRMGHAVTKAAAERDDLAVVAGVDVRDDGSHAYPVFASYSDVTEDADVIIDFSAPGALDDLLAFARARQLPAVLCATGYSDEQIEAVRAASAELALLRSGNMSLGINLLSALAKTAAKVLGTSFDVEIVEAHHNRKLDAPSGTALMLEKSIEEGLDYEPELVYDRHERRQKRDHREIGMHAIRGGTIVGEHEIIFAGNDEIIRLSHTAMSRNVFAVGALNAAAFLPGKAPGLYDMSDVIAAS